MQPDTFFEKTEADAKDMEHFRSNLFQTVNKKEDKMGLRDYDMVTQVYLD